MHRTVNHFTMEIKTSWTTLPTISKLEKLYYEDNKFKSFIKNLKIITVKIEQLIERPEVVEKGRTFGFYRTFISYLIRYRMCCISQQKFKNKCAGTIKTHNPNVDLALIENIKKSYNNMKNGIADDNDIYNTSLSSEIIAVKYDLRQYDFLKKNHINNLDHSNLDEYLKNKIENKTTIIFNPEEELDNWVLGVCTKDIDLIIDDELICIKITKEIRNISRRDFVRLLIYSFMYHYAKGIKCKKLTILNPLLGYEKYIDLNNWDSYDELFSIVYK